ncbi:MAG TPA: hypothetical protein VN752_09675, partial [Solirubrobacterales bacterium]|nr:hypothetical protein [Solirubrobacterales bacterium]
SAGNLYAAEFHGAVAKYSPSAFPPTATTTYTAQGEVDPGPATGIAVDPDTDQLYVNRRTHLAVYDAAGAHLKDIGAGALGDAYGVAVSNYGPTEGRTYVPDAATETVKVFDAAGDPLAPITGLPGGFSSLREAAVAVDDGNGDVYVLDNTQPQNAEQPLGVVYVFTPSGAHKGHLQDAVVDGMPSGLAIDNGGARRAYLTSGNTHNAGIYAYPANAAELGTPLAPQTPPTPLGGDTVLPSAPVGGPAPPPGGVLCEGDNCQRLPSAPVDPTLTTRLRGLGNPKVRYFGSTRACKRLARDAAALERQGRRAKRAARRASDRRRAARLRERARALAKRAERTRAVARRCARAARGGAGASASAGAWAVSANDSVGAEQAASLGLHGTGAVGRPSPASSDPDGPTAASSGPATRGLLLPGAAGFAAVVWAAGGQPATLAGSHPYALEFSLGLEQGAGEADLRELRLDLPPGLVANPAVSPQLCSAAAFATPRTSPFEASASGESCPDSTQVGTVSVESGAGGGQSRSFGLFALTPAPGAALRFGAAPFGSPLVFEGELRAGGEEPFGLSLLAEVPEALAAQALSISLWGVPWDASHDPQRGNCLNEQEPDFGWGRCSVGEPNDNRPLALLTLPTHCGEPLGFAAQLTSWQGATDGAQAVGSAPLAGCESLDFEDFALGAEGLLSTKNASTSTGFVFRLVNDDPGLADPRARIRSLPRQATVALPEGVTINPSVGAGLEVCTPGQLGAESPFNPPGAGCPNGAKIGVFRVRMPFYDNFLAGGIYLAQPDDPDTAAPGAENPFDSLLAVYLVAKSAERGILIALPAELRPDPASGTITAIVQGLPQLPYTDLEINFRSGQRAPLISPPACAQSTTQIALLPYSGGAGTAYGTDTDITAGIGGGPCPNGTTPPFAPGAVAGGVNSNVGSYTPYFLHLSRKDTEQEITSYSLILPKGITGRLAGIPFCPEAAIAAARGRQGFDEIASPSCPAQSQVGRTETGYGVGGALTYAPGRIYLAGPYHGSPLSLVTINAATVGPFDLGTIVIRSAFDVDEHTAQLEIDSSASDAIPHIIEGVPLHLRDIRIHMDRPQFTHNPSSCEASQLISTLAGSGKSFATPQDDSKATVTEHFQLLNCLTLGFKPKLGLRLRGAARRGAFPQLRASFASRGAIDSNLRRIEVEMPHALFLAQNHIRSVCSREQFATASCPPGSVYGRAAAHTPLFDEPLRGAVYLRSSESTLPDLVADLRSGAVRIVVEGRIGPGRHGGIRTFFDNLPDAPIERFTMVLDGGRRGLLQNSSNICANPPLATVSALAQNNIGARFSSVLRGTCKAKGKKGQGKGGRR